MSISSPVFVLYPILQSQTNNIQQGATPRELLLEACRRNNTDLLNELLADVTKAASSKQQSPIDQIAKLLNDSTDGIGNYCLHVAATYGSCMSQYFPVVATISLLGGKNLS